MRQNLKSTVWGKHSAQWGRIGSPCRPTAEDGQLLLQLAASALNKSENCAALVIMGVTPEIVQLAWPDQTHLQAFDHSADMIAAVWRPNPKLPSVVRHTRWQEMPLADHTADCVVGDGSLTVIETLGEYPEVLAEVARVLKPEGALVLRFFVSPDKSERLDDIAADAFAGRIESFHAFKWRIAMAMSAENDYSVRLLDVFHAVSRLFPDRETLSARAGWPRESIDTIDAFDAVQSHVTFSTLNRLREIAAPAFEMMQIRRGHYELAECCPTICFAPRNMDL